MDLLSNTSPHRSCQSAARHAPRLISSSHAHISVFVPVPDASSFRVLAHWIYFGQTQLLAECLARGVVSWEGVARNVEYLQLGNEIRSFLGNWWARHLRPGLMEIKGQEEMDEDVSGSDSEGASDFSTTESASEDDDEDMDDVSEESGNYHVPRRGRSRTPYL
jgi:hypothetical protein